MSLYTFTIHLALTHLRGLSFLKVYIRNKEVESEELVQR